MQLVPFATNEEEKKASLRVYFLQDKTNSASTFTEVNTCILMKWRYLFFLMNSKIHLRELIPPKMTWVNGSYTVKFVCCHWY